MYISWPPHNPKWEVSLWVAWAWNRGGLNISMRDAIGRTKGHGEISPYKYLIGKIDVKKR
jgi:hypothetical protein